MAYVFSVDTESKWKQEEKKRRGFDVCTVIHSHTMEGWAG